MKLDPSVGEEQTKKLQELRKSRDSEKAAACIAKITQAAAGDENLMPYVIEAVKSDCTLGEIMNAMKVNFGTYMAPSGF